MFREISLLIMALLWIVPNCFGQELLSSSVRDVTVYTQGALVKKVAEVKVGIGVEKIQLDIVSSQVQFGSEQAMVRGDGEIYGVEIKNVPLMEDVDVEVEALKNQLLEKQDYLNAISAKLRVLLKQEQYLESVVRFSEGQLPKDVQTSFPTNEQLTSAMSFVKDSFDSVETQKLDFLITQRELNEEIELIKKELQLKQHSGPKQKMVVEVQFESKKEQTIFVEVSYIAYQAKWNPLYKISVADDLNNLELQMFGKVWQKTGEDWVDVKLSLSNVIPMRSTALPQIYPWFLDLYRQPEAYAKRKSMDMAQLQSLAAPAADRMESSDDKVMAEEASFAVATKQEGLLAFEYGVPLKMDIPSQDQQTQLPLFSKNLEATYYYRLMPKMDLSSYLVAEVVSDEELLPGLANIYFGKQYVGNSHLLNKKAGESFEFNLGADRNVLVKREKIVDKVKETTFFGKMDAQIITRMYEFKMTIENQKDQPIHVRAFDSVPVSKTDKIQVKELAFSVSPFTSAEELAEKGVCEWRFVLNAKEKKVITWSYQVTHPNGERVIGL